MGRIHVLDCQSLLGLQGRPDADACLIGMTAILQDHRLCFPNEVIDELDRLATDEPVLLWARTAADGRCHKGAIFDYTRLVLERCPGLVDKSASHSQEPSAPYVAAQGLELQANGADLVVVTEDVTNKPTRQPLQDACEGLELPHQRLGDFLEETGIP